MLICAPSPLDTLCRAIESEYPEHTKKFVLSTTTQGGQQIVGLALGQGGVVASHSDHAYYLLALGCLPVNLNGPSSVITLRLGRFQCCQEGPGCNSSAPCCLARRPSRQRSRGHRDHHASGQVVAHDGAQWCSLARHSLFDTPRQP